MADKIKKILHIGDKNKTDHDDSEHQSSFHPGVGDTTNYTTSEAGGKLEGGASVSGAGVQHHDAHVQPDHIRGHDYQTARLERGNPQSAIESAIAAGQSAPNRSGQSGQHASMYSNVLDPNSGKDATT